MHIHNERGIALVTVLLVTMVVLTLMSTAAVLGGNTSLVTRYRQRETLLTTVADAGIEEARSAVNGTRTLMPDTGYKAFETRAVVYDAPGNYMQIGLRNSQNGAAFHPAIGRAHV